MSQKSLLIVVMGYGCHLTEEMKSYLDTVVQFVNQQPKRWITIVTTGGYTNRRSAPGISEAGMMANYLATKVGMPIIQEENARTTNENLKNVAKLITAQTLSADEVIIFCDKCRAVKVRLLARFILGRWPVIRSYRLTRGAIPRCQQVLLATPLDVLSLWIPFLEKKEIRRREKIINRS